MANYFIRRIGYMLVTAVLISVVGFAIINLPPGTFLDVKIAELEALGSTTARAQVEALEKRYRLNDPVYVQYARWISGFVRGDFGTSFLYNRPVKELIGQRLFLTIVVSTCTLVFTYLVAIPIGIYSACNQYTKGDYFFTFLGFAGLSIPSFLLALVVMVIGAMVFDQSVGGLFSPQYIDAAWSWAKFVDLLKHLWIPVLVVGTAETAGLIRMMRANLLDVLNHQYVQTARSKGLKESTVIYKHAVRNAIHPLIMQLGMSLPEIISGTTVVGLVLNLPTMGPLYFRALRSQDMFLAGTFLMFMAFMLLVGNLLADLLLAWVDPRIRYD